MRKFHKSLTFDTVTQAFARGEGKIYLRSGKSGENKILSRAELTNKSCAAAKLLRQCGVEDGARVVAVLPNCEAFLLSTFGAWFAGGAIVPVACPAPSGSVESYQRKMAAIIRIAQPKVIIGNQASLAAISGLEEALNGVRLISDEEMSNQPNVGELSPLYEPAAEDAAHIQFTSGSTGFPKAVVSKHQQIAANVRGIGEVVAGGQPTDNIFVSWLPVHHDMGFVGGLCFPLYHGFDLHWIPTETFIRNPAIWLRTISDAHATLSPAPTFAYDLLGSRVPDSRLEGIDLSSWRYAWVGAEPIFQKTQQNFDEKFRRYGLRADTLKPCYGLAEATLAVTLSGLSGRWKVEWINRRVLQRENVAGIAVAGERDAMPITCCGAPILDTEIRIVNERGETLDERRQGKILVRGSSVMQGYLGDAASPIDSNGWLNTGDYGFQIGDELFVTGRAKDVIIRGGANIHPQEIEHAAESVAGVRMGRTAAFSIVKHDAGTEEIVLVVETKTGDETERARLIDEIKRETVRQAGVRLDRVELVPSGFVEKTTSGKIQRAACRAKLLRA